MYKNFFLILLAMVVLVSQASGKETPSIYEFTLDNGLKVVVKEDHRAPVVISQLWYKVGSADEYSGITGVSHVLEHMMYTGTERYENQKFSAIVAENGGSENAFTARDYTGYYQTLEKSRLPISFELESDRMQNLLLNEKYFSKELEVVKEERRQRTEDRPNALAYEQLYALAFNNSGYHHPVIGWMQDLDTMRLQDLQHWYRQWYTPNNATLVVVGDVNANEVYSLAQKYFGDIKQRPLPETKLRKEAPQKGERRAIVKAAAELPYILMGYKTPALNDNVPAWEPYALVVLSEILDGGLSARLSKDLVREQEIAASAGAGYSLYTRLGAFFFLDGTPAQGHSISELEAALGHEIEHVKSELVSSQELERVIANVIAGKVYEQDSVYQQASLIGQVETIGLGWRVLDEYVDRVQAITPEQIREVARKYLVDDSKSVVVVEPLPINGKQIDDVDAPKPEAG